MNRRRYALAVGILATLGLHALARRVEMRYVRDQAARVAAAREEGRRLASIRDDLVALGVEPSTLALPAYVPPRGRPAYDDAVAGELHLDDCRYPQRACTCFVAVPITHP